MVPCCASHSGRLLLMSQRCALSPLPPLPSLRREIAPSGPCRVLQRGHNRPETSVCLTVGRVWRKSGTRLWASHWLTFKPDTKAWMPLNNGMFMQVESHRVTNSTFKVFLCMTARGKRQFIKLEEHFQPYTKIHWELAMKQLQLFHEEVNLPSLFLHLVGEL